MIQWHVHPTFINSLEEQLNKCEKDGWTIVQIFVDHDTVYIIAKKTVA